MVPSFVLSHVPPCDVPQGYASVVPFPAALLDDHFEHPTRQSAHRIEDSSTTTVDRSAFGITRLSCVLPMRGLE